MNFPTLQHSRSPLSRAALAAALAAAVAVPLFVSAGPAAALDRQTRDVRATPVVAAPASPAGAVVRTARTAVVYRGAGGCAGCSEAVARMLAADPQNSWTVKYAGENETLKVTDATLRGADLYVQPGGKGSIGTAWPALGTTGQRAVKKYVEGGGNFLGLCMGGWLTGSFGSTGWGWVPGVRSVQATSGTVVPTTWAGVGARKVYFAGGSSFGTTKPGTDVLATYGNGTAAAVVVPAGAGTVGVIGPHVEADKWWYSASAKGDTDGYDADLGVRLVQAVLAR